MFSRLTLDDIDEAVFYRLDVLSNAQQLHQSNEGKLTNITRKSKSGH